MRFIKPIPNFSKNTKMTLIHSNFFKMAATVISSLQIMEFLSIQPTFTKAISNKIKTDNSYLLTQGHTFLSPESMLVSFSKENLMEKENTINFLSKIKTRLLRKLRKLRDLKNLYYRIKYWKKLFPAKLSKANGKTVNCYQASSKPLSQGTKVPWRMVSHKDWDSLISKN
jgi:hypothetical protein